MAISLQPKFFGLNPTLGMATLAGRQQVDAPELIDLTSDLGDTSAPAPFSPPKNMVGRPMTSSDLSQKNYLDSTIELPNGTRVPKSQYNYGAPGIGNNFQGGVGVYDYQKLGAIRRGIEDYKLSGFMAEVNDQSNQIDSVTRQELAFMFSNHTASADTLLQTLSQAKAGTGMFGVRRVNEAQKKFLASHPGRSQLIAGLNRF